MLTKTIMVSLVLCSYPFSGMALEHFPPDPERPLSTGEIDVGVIAGGLGLGDVVSDQPGINCPSNASSTECRHIFPGSVTLRAIPRPGSEFTGWSGACHDFALADTCTVSGYNESIWVGAGFVSTDPTPDVLTPEEILNDAVPIFEVVDEVAGVVEGGAFVLERISGQAAARKYNWFTNAISKNVSNNLRGMIISKNSHAIYKFTGKVGKFASNIGFIAAGAENVSEWVRELDAIITSDADIQEKANKINLACARLPVETVTTLGVGFLHSANSILRTTKWINPTYWADYFLFEGQNFNHPIDTVDFWADSVDVFVEEYDTDRLYEQLFARDVEISSDRFVEYLAINNELSQAGIVPLYLTEEAAIQRVMEFYNTKGEFAGRFTMESVNCIRLAPESDGTVAAHVAYTFRCINPPDCLGNPVIGNDERIFEFGIENDQWTVINMAGQSSGSCAL